MAEALFSEKISENVWSSKYRLTRDGHTVEPDIQETWARVAFALSAAEVQHRDDWCQHFKTALSHFKFLPGGRILAGAGAHPHATLFNCFVMGHIGDSIDAIFSALSEAMVTMQAGGGVGCDFSSLRPKGVLAASTGNIASGPVSFMHVWDKSCETLMSTGMRRGAMMATLRCDHPDIERFIDAKRDPQALRHFNLSVLVSDDFMRAVEEDAPWPLVFPLDGRPAEAVMRVCERIWSGRSVAEPCVVMHTVSARELWHRLMQAAFDCGDPGVIFIDRLQRSDNLWYTERICTTNPCGEVPLPAHGACNLGSINLAQFVHDPFGRHARLDLQAIAAMATMATRMLDDVYEVSHFPLNIQKKVAHSSRRLGLGITGLADAFTMLGVRYGSQASLEVAERIMQTICHAAYRASIGLVAQRGVFPAYRETEYLAGEFISSLPLDIVQAIQANGIHNSHLIALAPTGSISLLANNVSSGIEPIYALQAVRKIRQANGMIETIPVQDYAAALFRKLHGEHTPFPNCFVEAHDVPHIEQLKLLSVLQPYVDQGISKTINLADNASFEDCREVYKQAYELGLKGCTIFRSNGKAGILFRAEPPVGIA